MGDFLIAFLIACTGTYNGVEYDLNELGGVPVQEAICNEPWMQSEKFQDFLDAGTLGAYNDLPQGLRKKLDDHIEEHMGILQVVIFAFLMNDDGDGTEPPIIIIDEGAD